MDKLKPCPFCGGEAVIVEASGTAWKDREGEYIICDGKCKRVWMEANKKTIALWNARPAEDDLRQQIDELITNSERLKNLLVFADASIHRGKIGNMASDAVEKHADLMRSLKVQDAIDKTLKENTEAWKKLAEE